MARPVRDGSRLLAGERGVRAWTAIDASTMRPNSQTLSGYFLGAELFFGDRAHPRSSGYSTTSRTAASCVS
jgi:hypothetical protein